MAHRKTLIIVVVFLAAAILIAAPFIGMKELQWGEIFTEGSSSDHDIFWKIRVPRVLTAFLAGAALALSGMVFQALFRNPLATPFTLGVSAGAAFGAALAVKTGLTLSLLGLSSKSIFAFTGALMSISLVYGLTRLRRGFSTSTMLLAGVAVSFFFSSLILFLQYLSDFTRSFHIVRWLMGGLEIVGYTPVMQLLPFIIPGSLAVFLSLNELNLFLLGEDLAISRGVNVGRLKGILFIATSLMVGGVVAITGPIGFVGMMSPHICRILIGHDHRDLSIVTLLFGGGFLTACDTLSRTIIAPAEIPVGVITALLGGPFFLWLLLKGDSEKSIFGDE